MENPVRQFIHIYGRTRRISSYFRFSSLVKWYIFPVFFLCIDDIDILKGKCSKDRCFHRQLMGFPIKHRHNMINPKTNCKKRNHEAFALYGAVFDASLKRCECPHGVTIGRCKQVKQVVSPFQSFLLPLNEHTQHGAHSL